MCQNRHHISICEDDNKNGDQTRITFTDNVNNNILLQTAKGKVSSVGINKYCDVRILFDSGSQRSYLTDDLRKRLNLRTIRSENLVVQTFGNTQSEMKKVDIVQLKVRGKNSTHDVYIEAICVPVICSPLRNQRFSTSIITLV